MHVQQDEIGAQGARGCDGAQTVLGLADDVVALQLQEPASRRPEGGVIVNDEYSCSHRKSLVLPTHLPKVVTMRTDGRATAPFRAVIVAARDSAHMAVGDRLARSASVARGSARRETRALDVVRDVTGLHAQLMSSAELTLWARVDGLERGAVERALWEDRTLVKTWAMRGTLHLLRADELPLWVAAQSALKPRHHVPSWLRHHGLTREQADAMLDAIPVALDGGPLTREELAAEVARVTGIEGLDGKLRGGFGDLLKPAAFRGDLCFAPNDGRNVRFARPDQWLGPQPTTDRDEAMRDGRAALPRRLRAGDA